MAEPLTLYKLIVLYMLDKVKGPLTNSQISEFILDHEYTSYFHLQQAIAEMEDSGLLRVESDHHTTYYRLTDDGITTLSFFSDEISPEIKTDIQHFLDTQGHRLKEEVSAMADYYKTTGKEYAVRCQLKERSSQLLDLTIAVPSREAAQAVCDHWAEKSQELYAHLLENLI